MVRDRAGAGVRPPRPPKADIRIYEADSRVVIEVEDDGCGIVPARACGSPFEGGPVQVLRPSMK